MRCTIFHKDGTRSHRELNYEDVAQHVRIGDSVFTTFKWDDDPEWEAKASQLARMPK